MSETRSRVSMPDSPPCWTCTEGRAREALRRLKRPISRGRLRGLLPYASRALQRQVSASMIG
eukprot:7087404-Alexandrium_andersonii.AAC.1